MPARISAAPTGVTENNPQVSICCSVGSAWLEVRIRSFSRINGLEPTMVMVPPRMAVKPMGISRRDMGSPERAEMRETTGRNSAAAPTFCMKEEMKPTVAEMMGMIRFSVVPPIFRIKAATLPMMPVRSRPAPMIITAMMEITALDEKPSNRCLLSTRPCSSPMKGANREVSPSNTITVAAATSTPTTSKAKR